MVPPAIEMGFEAVEVGRPERPVGLEPRVQFHERLGPDPVQAALAVGAHVDEPRVSQYPQVLRHSRLADAEFVDEFAHGAFAVAQQLEDRDPPRLGEDLERSKGGGHLPNIRL